MASILSSFTFLFIMVAFSVLICPSSSDPEELINHVCSRARDFGICHRFFRNRVYAPTMDMKGLCYIILGESISLIESTHKLIHILKAREHDKDVQNRYLSCENSYEVLTYELEKAASAFDRGDYRGLLFYLAQCDRLLSDNCESVIGLQVAEILSKRNIKAREWISMSLAASEYLNVGN